MGITYGTYTFDPVPFSTISKRINSRNGNDISFGYDIVLNGHIVETNTSGMDKIVSSQKAILTAFKTSGLKLTIDSPDQSQSMVFYPEVKDVEFSEGTWVDICPFKITLTATKLEGVDDALLQNIKDYNETWTMTYNGDKSYSITHNIYAIGRNTIDDTGVVQDGLLSAKAYVNTLLAHYDGSNITFAGFDPTYSGAVLDGGLWNRGEVETIDTSELRYQVTETFVYHILVDGLTKSREEWSANISEKIGSYPQKAEVSISGKLFGLSTEEDNPRQQLNNAKSDWDTVVQTSLVTRVLGYIPTGYTINPTPIAKQISYTDNSGILDYSVVFVATKGTLLENAIEESLEITENFGNDIFASIAVPGRSLGPVMQYMETKTSPTRSVSYSCRLSPAVVAEDTNDLTSTQILASYSNQPDTDFIFSALRPIDVNNKYYIQDNSQTWDPSTLSYQRTVVWAIDISNASSPYYTGHKDLAGLKDTNG